MQRDAPRMDAAKRTRRTSTADPDLSCEPSPGSTAPSSPPPSVDAEAEGASTPPRNEQDIGLRKSREGKLVAAPALEAGPVTRSGKVLQAYTPKHRLKPERPRTVQASEHIPTLKPKRTPKERLEMILSGQADLATMGQVHDAEDLYLAKVALERLQGVKASSHCPFPDVARVLDELVPDNETEDIHDNGCSRAQGLMRITPRAKVHHVPTRQEEKAAPQMSKLAMGALARQRRAAEAARQEEERDKEHDNSLYAAAGGAAGDLLRTCKKALKFAKSRIHDWGLYAAEPIAPRQMVIEYVGELVRHQVANERETRYERSGQFSTYLFRVDDDLVVDATCKGNTARLMNHCCRPNCTADIVTIKGQKRIVVYSKQWILPGAELTYDYKLAHSSDEEPIPCLCGAEGCRRFL